MNIFFCYECCAKDILKDKIEWFASGHVCTVQQSCSWYSGQWNSIHQKHWLNWADKRNHKPMELFKHSKFPSRTCLASNLIRGQVLWQNNYVVMVIKNITLYINITCWSIKWVRGWGIWQILGLMRCLSTSSQYYIHICILMNVSMTNNFNEMYVMI